jgi:adenylate cyclase
LAGVLGLLGILLSGPVRIWPVERTEYLLRDWLTNFLPPARAHEDLVFLTIDEGAFNLSHLEPEEIAGARALQLMEMEFPWSRAVYAEALQRLFAAGAERVLLDIHFALPGRGDEELAAVAAAHPGRIVFGAVLDHQEEIDGSLSVSWKPPTRTVTGGLGREAEGFVNFWPDRDGVVRTADYRTTASLAKGAEALPGEEEFYSLSGSALRQAGQEELLPTPGGHLLRFVRAGGFPAYPLWTLFVPDFWERNLRGGEVFQGKTVVVGGTAARFKDVFSTPINPRMPGPELHLNALSAALLGSFFTQPPWWVGAFLCLLGAGGAAWLFARRRTPWVSLGGLAAILAGYFFLVLGLAWMASWLLPLLLPLAVIAVTGLGGFVVDFSEERRQRRRVRRVLERYVSREIVREVLDAPGDFFGQLGGARKEVVVLFSDLRGFTSLVEKSDPVKLVTQLNEYLGAMVEIVFDEHGTIDKFIGDAVMAVWGSVGGAGPEEDARRALRAARRMIAALEELNRAWQAGGRPPLHLGIGLHAGPAIFGNIGSAQKMELTVIGDTVNLASRLEGLCKGYGVPLVVSETVRERAGDADLLALDLVRVVGRQQPVEIFAPEEFILGKKVGAAELWQAGMDALRRGDLARARAAWEQLPQEMRERDVPRKLLARLEEWEKISPLPEGWSAVVDLRQK